MGGIMEFPADILNKYFRILFEFDMGEGPDKSGTLYFYLVTKFSFNSKV